MRPDITCGGTVVNRLVEIVIELEDDRYAPVIRRVNRRRQVEEMWGRDHDE
jgi:hypothetical protein